ncbi:MAG: hypothetical protein WDO19_15620 [Bacteroidota bacterium]
MDPLNQHTIISSLQKALVPAPRMIDGRTERDRLWFLSAFAGLINFYNTDNNREGSWRPFLLKDPVFLLAFISKN